MANNKDMINMTVISSRRVNPPALDRRELQIANFKLQILKFSILHLPEKCI